MAAHQAPPSLGFSRQEHWSGLPFPSPVHGSESESEVAQSCPTLSDPWTAAHQAPSSMGFSRQEYWSGVPLPSPLQSASQVKMRSLVWATITVVMGLMVNKCFIWGSPWEFDLRLPITRHTRVSCVHWNCYPLLCYTCWKILIWEAQWWTSITIGLLYVCISQWC